jgi:hypothetical protein
VKDYYMFTERQNLLLRALIDRIIPADQDPGGWDAGVGDYLMRQLQGDLKHLHAMYRAGLDALDAEAQQVCGQSFDLLPAAVQDDLLRSVEAGKVDTAWAVDPVQFFGFVVQHCAEGFYSDPGQGGNRDQVAWRMIGFEVRS